MNGVSGVSGVSEASAAREESEAREASGVSEIVPGVFLGSWKEACHLDLLLNMGITHILNCSGLKNMYPEKFEYMKIDIEDDENTNIAKYFNKANRFICNTLVKKGKVLVHCFAGVSRSPTLILAFLIRKRRYKFIDAFNLVKSKRRCIDPNSGFIQQLQHI